MYNKLYLNIKKIVKNNYILFVGIIVGFLLVSIKLPFYILAPGGVNDVSTKMEIENHPIRANTFNLTYLYEFRATVPTILYSYFNKDWDVYKKSDIEITNETPKDADYRDHLLLKEANQNAIIVAYTKALKKYEVKSEKVIISYVDKSAKTDLIVGDEILTINNEKITNLPQMKKTISSLPSDEVINFKVKNKNKIFNRQAKTFKIKDKTLIGVLISIDREIETDPKIKLNFEKKESGPSGGLMMSLAIYDALTNYSINNFEKIAGTGTIDEDGNVGEIGGIEYKIKGAVKEKIKIFLAPAGENYEEAIKVKEKYNYDIEIISVSTFDDALNFLKSK